MFEIIARRFSPLVQVAICCTLALVSMGLCRAFVPHRGFEFASAFVLIMLYCIVNPFLSIFHDKFVHYTWPSWGLYAIMLVVLLLAARYISGHSIREFSSYLFMLKSISGFYIVASLLTRLIRTMWEFAEKDEP